MPHYYFHAYDDVAILDNVGTDYPNLSAAKQDAVDTALDLLRARGALRWNAEPWRLEVADKLGKVLLTLSFKLEEAASV